MRLDSLAAAQALLLGVPGLPALHLLAKLQGCQSTTSTTAASDEDMVPPRTGFDTNCHGLSGSVRKVRAAPAFLLEDRQAFIPIASPDLRVLQLSMQREMTKRERQKFTQKTKWARGLQKKDLLLYEGVRRRGEDPDDGGDEESESGSDSEKALNEPSKNAIYNGEALLEKLEDIAWPENAERVCQGEGR
uniref:Uncharacterized protein n=1 Tax=Ananas comosus var. bracteatus TaxID=296719 RepID=A0A6V7QPE6_ANACO|nr:unnamed protein product [Ananas comosus var. bracteatus]